MIVRVAAYDRYTQVRRRTINDNRLSWKARGLLVWLLDKPDNWHIEREGIAKAGPDGEHAVRSALRELSECGYLRRTRVRHPDGTFHTESVLYESPPDPPPLDGFPPADNPPADNPPAEASKTQASKTEEPPNPSSSPSEPSRPVNQNRETAQRITRAWWDSQDPKPTTKFIGAVQVVEKLVRAGWTEAEISAACAQCPTLSAGWLEPKLRTIRNPRQTNGYRESEDEAWERMEREDADNRAWTRPAQ